MDARAIPALLLVALLAGCTEFSAAAIDFHGNRERMQGQRLTCEGIDDADPVKLVVVWRGDQGNATVRVLRGDAEAFSRTYVPTAAEQREETWIESLGREKFKLEVDPNEWHGRFHASLTCPGKDPPEPEA